MTTPAEIDEAVTIITDLITVGSLLNPQLAIAAPLITDVIRYGATNLKAGIAAGAIVPDGQGGFVSKTWADDPRHQLNPDGSFKF
jgi:hypothetical protein